MTLLPLALLVALVLGTAYLTYGRLLGRLFRLDPDAATPAVALQDGIDHVPTEPKYLIGQHFSAIAAAGPIVGPILAGAMFGWLPALLWILVGSVFVGGVHDFSALVASIRHQGKSIARVVRDHVNRRAFILFLLFIWLALVYIIVAFTDITAQAFVGEQTLENGQVVRGAGIATSSLLYLLIPIAMGLLLRYTKLSLAAATAIFLPLVIAAIVVGQYAPLDLGAWLGISEAQTHKVWDVAILLYCVAAAMTPMWLLLQPRGHLGGFFLFGFLAVGVLGALLGGEPVRYPAFVGWTTAKGETLAPILFITIACGAVSGFHSLIASGTTAKQLKRETDARPIGYGTMLLEGGVAFLALSCVMMLPAGGAGAAPNLIFANGIGGFLERVGVPATIAISIMLMAFTTFVYDTLDVCTRLGRYIVQELTGWHDRRGAWLGTVLTAAVPLLFVTQQMTDAAGKPVPAWRVFWGLFGASNQLLAALTLLGVTVWLARTGRRWAFAVTGLPCLLMYVMSCWALFGMVRTGTGGPVAYVGALLLVLAAWMLVEAVGAFRSRREPTPVTA
ncbi:MAG TPA: carbon starvation CstA family protein [Fimbriimonas sp.]